MGGKEANLFGVIRYISDRHVARFAREVAQNARWCFKKPWFALLAVTVCGYCAFYDDIESSISQTHSCAHFNGHVVLK
jgi:hypothetical protein